jgi:hypothetical protein
LPRVPLYFRKYNFRGEEYQSEVALLSRSILLLGPESANTNKKGGHVMISGQVRLLTLSTSDLF